MKTQYFRKPRRFLSVRQGAAALVAVVLFLILILVRMFAPGVFTAIASPFWGTGTFLASHLRLPEGDTALKEQVGVLTKDNEALANENQLLRAGKNKDTEAGVTADVLARPPLSPYDVLVVGKGNADGVYGGMRVFSQGIPVGVVESVASRSAHVVLYSASGKATEGWIGEEHVPVTLKGLGAGAFSADVPREAAIVEGDAVHIPGAGGLPMGIVIKVESNASSPRATLRIRPAANPFTITSVVILAAPAL